MSTEESPETPTGDAPEQPSPAARGGDDIGRRAALIATAVALPVVIAVAVVVNVVGGGSSDASDGPVADVSGATTQPGRADDLPPVTVDTPAVTPAADLACPVLMQQLPLELLGEPSRLVKSDSPYAYAWGDPAVVLVCGVAPPAGYTVGTHGIQIDQVLWYVDTESVKGATVWTTVDRNVPVQVTVPADSAPVTALGKIIGNAIPYVDPTPAGG